MAASSRKYLFGGDQKWAKCDWTACDDRLRGGNSISYLGIKSCSTDSQPCQDQSQPQPQREDLVQDEVQDQNRNYSTSAIFRGNLDATALGGAGFASHRNTTNTLEWNLADYDGIEILIGKSDGKRYIFIVKDELLPKKPDGGDRSSLNWEYEFVVPTSETMRESSVVRIRWNDFLPTYRGRLKDNLGRMLDVTAIKRVNIMMRSFFGYQEGDFELEIKSIAAFKEEEEIETTIPIIEDGPGQQEIRMGVKDRAKRRTPSEEQFEEEQRVRQRRGQRNWLTRLLSACCRV